MKTPLLHNESQRLFALREYEILDTPPEPEFDDIAALAAEICETPIAFITLVDETRLWVKARVGFALEELPRDQAFCAHALGSRDLLLVPDAREDERFANNPLVTHEPQLRFYAGAPLLAPTGEVLGALCVIDRVPRQLTERQASALKILSRQVMTKMQLSRQLRTQALAEHALRQSELDQRQLAGQLSRQKQQLEEAQAVAKVGSWETNLATLEVAWSEETFRIFETTPEKFQPTHAGFLELVHPEDRARVDAAFVQSLGQLGVWKIEHRLLFPNGRSKFVEERWQSFEAEGERPRRAVGTCQDITDRIVAEGKLHHSRQLAQMAGRLARIGAWTINVPGSELYWSDEIYAILEVPPGQLPTTERSLDFYPPEWRKQIVAALDRCAEDGTPFDLEVEILTAKNRRLWVRAVGEAERDQEGLICRVQGAFQDISESKSVQRELEAARAQYAGLVNSVDGIVWEADAATGQCTFVSPQAKRMLGFEPARWLGEPDFWARHIYPEDREKILRLTEQHTARKEDHACEYRLVADDGRVVWVRDLTTYVEEPRKPAVLRGIMLDITERKRLEILQACEARVLEAVSAGRPLAEILARTALGVEEILPDALASVMLVDGRSAQLRTGAAPSLPEAYNRAIDGQRIGEGVGSCGTAAHRREKVIVTDILSDPLWVDYRDFASEHGLRACWSVPVLDKTGQVIAAFAVYYRVPRAPEPAELELIARLVHIAGIAIERERKDRELRLLETSISRVNDIVLITEAEPQEEPGPRILYVNEAFVRRTGYSREEVIGRSPRFLQGPLTARVELDRIRAAMKKWEPVRAELINYKKSGEAFWLELEIVPVADATGWFTHWVAIERDISERKRTEEALRESEARSRAVIHSSLDAIVTMDHEGRIVEFNPAAEQIFGWSRAEAMGRELAGLMIPHRMRAQHHHSLARHVSTGVAHILGQRLEMSALRADGTEFPVELTVTRMDEVSPPRFTGFIRDVTAVRQAGEALRASEERFRLLAKATNDAIWDWDLATGALWWNEGFEKLFGLLRTEVEPTIESWSSRIHPDEKESVVADVHRVIEGGGDGWSDEYRFQCKSGDYAYVLDRGHIIRDADGKALRMIGGMTDLTERKSIEEELRRHTALLADSEEQYRMLFANNPLPMWVFDFETLRFLAVNASALAHYGYTEEEFLAMSICDIRPAEERDKIVNDLRKATPGGKRSLRSRHCKRNGAVIEVDVTSDTITFDGRPARLVLANDVTERVRAEAEAHRANRALRMLSRCNEALIRADSEPGLLTDICRIAVEVGGFRLAWVGYAQDDAEKTIAAQAHAGADEGYLATIRLSWAEEHPSGRGPAARAIRTGQPAVVADLTDERSGFLTVAEASARGYRGVVCLPLKDEARTFGQLALYLCEVRAVPPDELELLRELADDLAFGILNLRARAERRRTHDAVLAMARGVSASTGAEFFEKLLHSTIEALGAYGGFIAVPLPNETMKVQTVCVVMAGQRVPNFEYALAGTPCADVPDEDVWMVARDVQRRYPGSPLLAQNGIEAYVGAKMVDSAGRSLGLLVVQFQQPIVQPQFVASSLRIFATRAAAELQRQGAEAKTREQAELLDKARDAIVVRDLDHRIAYWNKSAERVYGWTAAEALGRSARQLLYVDREAFDRAMTQLLVAGEWVGEFMQARKDGKQLSAEGHWTLVRDAAGRPKSVLAINTDITERKHLEQQFLRAQRMESIGTLAGGIAHDLNNLLAPITMGVELLRRFEVNPKSLSLIDNMERSAKRGADLVKQVLSFARGVEGSRVALQVRHIIREVESIAENTFPKNIRIETDVSPDLWLVMADPTQLNQVLLNLCVNARDAMPEGGRLSLSAANIEIDAQYAVMNHGAAAGRYVVVKVSDTGCGMPREIIDRIFEPFFTTKELGKGTGLGLSTVLGIVRSHGGFVNVYSELGKGSVFKVHLPAQPDGTVADGEGALVEKFPRGNGELILVVDDETSILDITKQTLQTFGYRVLTAEDGAQAIGLYAMHREQVALVLTDMMMPVMDGPALIAALRRVNPHIRIVAASGLNANGNVARAAIFGVKHFLAKPYSADAMLTLLKQVLTDSGSTPPM